MARQARKARIQTAPFPTLQTLITSPSPPPYLPVALWVLFAVAVPTAS